MSNINKLISRLPKEKFENVSKIVKYKYDKNLYMSRHDYIVNFIKSTLKVRSNIELELNKFFIDIIELMLVIISVEKKVDEVDIERVKQLNKYISEYRCNMKMEDANRDNKNKSIDIEFCVDIISRLALIFNKHRENIYNCNDVNKYIVGNSNDINKSVLKLVNNSSSILIENLYKIKGIKTKDKQIRYSEIISELKNDIISTSKKIKLQKIARIYKNAIYIANPHYVSVYNTIKKHEVAIKDKKFLQVFEVALIIYENEYKISILGEDL